RRDRRPRARDAIEHGRSARTHSVRGRGGRRARLAAGRIHRLAADRPAANLRGVDERLAVRGVRAAQPRLCGDMAIRHLECHRRAGRADHALRTARADPRLPPDGPDGDARHMSDITARVAPPTPTATENLKFYGLWIAAGLAL